MAENPLPDPDKTHPACRPEATVAPSRARPSAATGSSLGRYDLLGHLGAGGMGEVIEAFDPALQRRVALKRITRGRAERFVEEAQVTARLDHPNIVPVYELSFDERGQPYYTMKEVRGRTLAELVGELPLARLLRIFLRICEAVAFAHSRGVLHRDLKPANVMVGEFGEVYVLDWGLAKEMRNAECGMRIRDTQAENPLKTREGAALGTPAYMSPEQAAGRIEQIDERSDVYLLGGILYECLTGHAPEACVRNHFIEPASRRAPARGIPAELEAIAGRALAREPEERYAGAAELAADVEAYLDGRLVSAARYSPATAAWKWARRHRYLVAGCLAVLCTVVAAVALHFSRQARTRAEARRAVEALDPPGRLAAAHTIVDALKRRAADRRSPTPGEKARYAGVIERLHELAFAQSNWRRVDPGSNDAGRALTRTFVALGRLALVSEDYALAQFAFGQAASLDPSSERIRALRAGVAEERQAVIVRHCREIDELLAGAARERLERTDDQAYRRAMAGLLRWRDEPQTMAHLRRRLDELTGLLRGAARDALLAANDLSADERNSGWKPLADLPAAVERWLAWIAPQVPGRPAAPAPTAAQQNAMRGALLRLELRAKAGLDREARTKEWRTLLAEAQARALRRAGPDRTIELALLCDALGTLDAGEASIAALVRCIGAEWDMLRALPAGLALAAFAGGRPALQKVLEELAGLRARERCPPRWTANGIWWRRVSEELRRKASRAEGEDRRDQPATAKQHLRRGMARLTRGKLDGALADLSRAIALDPSLIEARHNRGIVRLERGDLDGAIADFSQVIVLNPRDADAYASRGAARRRKGDLAGALADCDRAIALDARNGVAYGNRGAIRLDEGNIGGAIRDFTRAIELRPQLAQNHFNRGNARLQGGDAEGAIADYSRAVALDPNYAAGYAGRGNALQRKGDLDGAIADYDGALRLEPRSARTHCDRGRARRQKGDLRGAIADFDRAIALDGTLARAYILRGEARLHRRERDAALQDFDRAIALDPSSAHAYCLRGNARSARGDHAGALADLDRAVALDSRRPAAYELRALVRSARGDKAGALEDLGCAIALDPRQPGPYYNRGAIHHAQGRLVRAQDDYTRAIRADPNCAEAYNNRGNVRKASGDLTGAIADYTRAIVLQPRLAAAHYNRGVARHKSGEIDGAIEDFARAAALQPSHWRAWNNLGLLCARKGQRDRAVAALEQALRRAPARVRPQIEARLAGIRGKE